MLMQKRDFTLVFRTFGTDIEEVIDELNMFATGQHPAYPQVVLRLSACLCPN